MQFWSPTIRRMSLQHTKLISFPWHCVLVWSLHTCALLLAPGFGGYNVTVVTAPSKGPFRLHTSVTLSCRVNLQPPGTVTYSWKSSDPYSSLPSGNSTSPNTTFSISYERLCSGWYFCHVYSDGTLVGVGRTLVETEGQFYARKCFYVQTSLVPRPPSKCWRGIWGRDYVQTRAVCKLFSLCCRIYPYWLVTYTVLYSWGNSQPESEYLDYIFCKSHCTAGLVSQWNRGYSQLWEDYCERQRNRTDH